MTKLQQRFLAGLPILPAGRQRCAALLLSGLLAIFTSACSTSKEATRPASHEPENNEPSLFVIPANQLPHLQILPVQKTTWALTIRTTGTVDWDNDHTTQAIAQVSGPITRILVDTGTYVKAGQPLLEVSSPDVTTAVAAYRVAHNRLNLATSTLNRSRDLLDHHAIAQKDLEGAQADYNDAATQMQTTLQALRIFGITQKEIEEGEKQGVSISPQLAVRSPISGMVIQKLVFPGQLIQAGATTCFLISNVSTVWVQGHIYEKDLTSVRVGDLVEETSTALPEAFHGVISYIGAMVDPATRTTPVRIVTSNPKGLLKKDLFMDVVIHTQTKKDVLVAPASAVLYNADNQPFVYVQAGADKFAQRLVTIGTQQKDQIEITNGLKEGEKIVSAGSLFLQFANTYQQ
ncbi:MAG: efflux RND transporter periplasmic adaptor subunit [Acidobacteriia bacterium]|nr:efflux RND transporter periplasmic adaptor subunit [Terriglobia bacterium]